MRKKMQQLMVYVPMFTIYLTLEHAINQDEVAIIAQSIHNIDSEIINKAAKSLLYK
jgi:MFS superfamily sulfate permease-like transporter